MVIYRAEELKALLLSALDTSASLEVNLSAVTEIDTAGLQILLLLKQVSTETHKALTLVAHSEAVSDVFELLNLAPHFGDPLVMASSAPGRFQKKG